MDLNFITRGFTDNLFVNFNDELKKLQKLIYINTKSYLVDHDENLSIEKKLILVLKKNLPMNYGQS